MPTTVRDTTAVSHRELLADVRPVQAKAHLGSQVGTSRLREVCADAIRTVSGNARAAAIDMQIHEGHLSRSLKDGTIRLEQLEALGPAFAAKFGQELVEKFGPLTDPKDEARRALADLERAREILRQFVEVA